MNYETTIALRYLRSKRKDKFISFTTWIAIVGIAIGVMAIILVIAVMTGFQDEIRDRLLGIRPHIVLIPDWGVKDPKQVVERMKRIDGVVSASPFIEFQAMAQGPGAGGRGDRQGPAAGGRGLLGPSDERGERRCPQDQRHDPSGEGACEGPRPSPGGPALRSSFPSAAFPRRARPLKR